jgi:hypothetical protein
MAHTLNAPERRYILQRLNAAIGAAMADSMTVPLLEKATAELREALDCFEWHLNIARSLEAASAADVSAASAAGQQPRR